MISCGRKVEFDAAHRVIGHQNKCKFLHGHRYILEITAESELLNDLGMVVDFGLMKEIIKCWIDENLDHNVILSTKDQALGNSIAEHTGQKIYYIQDNPTAENIVLHLKTQVMPKLFINYDISISKLKLFETPNCFVEI